MIQWDINGIYLMTNSSPWDFDGPNRNRWFTELRNGDFPWRTVSHNQMVYIYMIVPDFHGNIPQKNSLFMSIPKRTHLRF